MLVRKQIAERSGWVIVGTKREPVLEIADLIAFNFQFASCNTADPAPQFKQTAQDGVQLDFANYNKSTNGQNPINVAPANRVDALVQAPMKAGVYVLGTTAAPLAFIRVTTVTPTPMGFPNTINDYPTMPPYLSNIRDDQIKKPRTIVYGWDKNRVGPGRDNNNAAPHYTIDGKQFQDGVVNQTTWFRKETGIS